MNRVPITVSLAVFVVSALAWTESGGGDDFARPSTSMKEMVERFAIDLESLKDFYALPFSEGDRDRTRAFYQEWLARLEGVDYEALDVAGRIDFHLLKNLVERDQKRAQEKWEKTEEAEKGYVPFRAKIVGLLERRRRVERVEGKWAAAELAALADEIEKAQKTAGEGLEEQNEVDVKTQILIQRSRGLLRSLRTQLAAWGDFYQGYDPMVTWWVKAPLGVVDERLDRYIRFLGEQGLGIGGEGEDEPVIGDPIGREALLEDLAAEFVAYTPDELVAIAEKEFAWCEREYLKASQELGFGDDWRKALEHVKNQFVDPGEQPYLIRSLAEETVGFLNERDLVTVPPLCEEGWEMTMMSPQRQKVSPFFLGGQTIQVSFPTDAMEHADKLMSLRGNNRHFARATVHHELIPGHHLQLFMADRYETHRKIFRTPFFIEGWALYWEMLLWDLDFAKTPEDRIGMLFWRSHRCARIIFSLKFHLGEMTGQEAIDFLVERVGHERANATAEVRRSVGGNYSPLYQAAYMLGGLQIMDLRREFVGEGAGKMTDREFHDALLRENSIPVEMVRASLRQELLEKNRKLQWRFYPEL